MEEKSQNLMMTVALPHWLLPGLACRWLQLFQCSGLLPFLSPSPEQISKLQMSGGVAGVPSPGARPPSPRPWKALLFSRCGRKPETQTGMREGLVTAARCVDRSVQLVLIPALFLSFPSRCRHVQ